MKNPFRKREWAQVPTRSMSLDTLERSKVGGNTFFWQTLGWLIPPKPIEVLGTQTTERIVCRMGLSWITWVDLATGEILEGAEKKNLDRLYRKLTLLERYNEEPENQND